MLISLIITVINIDYTSINVVLPLLANFFHVQVGKAQFVISAYTTMWASLLLLGGKLGDRFGYKRIFQIGLVMFILGTTLCALAPTISTLIIFRAIQGVGSGILYPNVMSLVFSDLPAEKKGLGMGVFSSMSAFGLVFGPVFAGIVTHKLGWPAIFYISAIISCLVLCYSVFSLKGLHVHNSNKLSIYKHFVSILGLTTIVFILGEPGIATEYRGITFAVLAVVISLILKLKSQKIKKAGFNKRFVSCCIVRGIIQFNFASILLLLSVLFQMQMMNTSLMSGLMLLPLTLVFGVLSPFAGKLVDKFNVFPLLKFGLLFLSISVLALSILNYFKIYNVYYPYFCLLSLFGLGMAFSYPAINTQALKEVASSIVAQASAIFILVTLIGVIAGVVFSSSMIDLHELWVIPCVNLLFLLLALVLTLFKLNEA